MVKDLIRAPFRALFQFYYFLIVTPLEHPFLSSLALLIAIIVTTPQAMKEFSAIGAETSGIPTHVIEYGLIVTLLILFVIYILLTRKNPGFTTSTKRNPFDTFQNFLRSVIACGIVFTFFIYLAGGTRIVFEHFGVEFTEQMAIGFVYFMIGGIVFGILAVVYYISQKGTYLFQK